MQQVRRHLRVGNMVWSQQVLKLKKRTKFRVNSRPGETDHYVCRFQKQYNSAQMFEPFQDQNQHLFGTGSLSWFVMKSISTTYRFHLFWTKPLRKKMWGQNLDFSKSNFQFLRWIWVFRTNMGSNSAVTRHFEDLVVQNYLFLKDVCICWWKISNCLKSTFDECEVFLFKYFEDQV